MPLRASAVLWPSAVVALAAAFTLPTRPDEPATPPAPTPVARHVSSASLVPLRVEEDSCPDGEGGPAPKVASLRSYTTPRGDVVLVDAKGRLLAVRDGRTLRAADPFTLAPLPEFDGPGETGEPATSPGGVFVVEDRLD